MLKYCFIIDNKKGLVQLGAGCSDDYYQEIGMKKRDVEQSDIDFLWYVKGKCPRKSDEQKFQEAKEMKYQEALDKANMFLNNEATFALSDDFHVEATKENMNSLASASTAINMGYIPYQEWTSKEDNVLQLNAEQCITITIGIGSVQTNVWTVQFIDYKNQIEKASTIEEVESIVIEYRNVKD